MQIQNKKLQNIEKKHDINRLNRPQKKHSNHMRNTLERKFFVVVRGLANFPPNYSYEYPFRILKEMIEFNCLFQRRS